MLTASTLEVASCREAAIVGGIVRSMVDHGRYYAPAIATNTRDTLNEWNLVGVDRTPPGMAEMAMVLDRFRECYVSLPPR